MKRRRHTKPERKIKIFRDQHILSFLFLLVILSAYYRGLYFDFERFFFYSIFWVVAGIFFFIRFFAFQEQISLKTGVEWSFLFLTLLYLINVIWAADKGLAFREFLTYFTFLLFFLVVEYTSLSWKGGKHWFLFFFGLSAMVLIFLSLGYHFGIVPPTVLPTYMSLKELFVGRRIYSNFQYPNTAAAYFAMAYFGMLTFSFWEERRFWRGLAFFCSFFILIGVMFTYSRGVFLTLPLTALFFMAILPRRLKVRFFFVGIISLVFLGTPFPFLERYLFGFQSGAFFALLFSIALAFGVVLDSIIEREDKFLRLSNCFYGLLGVGMAGCGVLIFLLGKYSSLLSVYLAQRIQGINFADPNVVGRLTFYRDALRIGLDRPINGWGGGGWKVLYLGYQTTPYFTESTHNYYAQVFVESGFLGIVLIVALLFFLFWETWKAKEILPEKEKFLALGILGMLFMGFVHGILDINFSLGAYHFAVWFFAGVLGGMTRNSVDRSVFYPLIKDISWSTGWGFLVSVVFLVWMALMAFGVEQGIVGEYLLQRGDLKNALVFYRDAVRFDPLNAEIHFGLSQVYRGLFLQRSNSQWRTLSEREAQKAYRLSPFRHVYIEHLGLLEVERGNFEKGLATFQKAVDRAPFLVDVYEHFALAYKSVGDFYLSREDKEKALEFYREGLKVWDLFSANTGHLPEPLKGTEKLSSVIDTLISLIQQLEKG